MLGALGSLIDGAVGAGKAMNDGKAARRQLEELQCHNRTMEGRGVYFAPYKHGHGVYLAPYKREQGVIIKKKKYQRGIKNTCGCDNECTIGSAGEAHARTIL